MRKVFRQIEVSKHPTRFALAMVSLSLILFNGCSVPIFRHALTNPESAEKPFELFGRWQTQPEDDQPPTWIVIESAGSSFPESFVRITVEQNSADGETSSQSRSSRAKDSDSQTEHIVYGFFFVDGDDAYFHIPVIDEVVEDSVESWTWNWEMVSGYYIFKVQFAGNQIQIAMPDVELLKIAIQNGQLSGSVKKGDRSESVLVESKPVRLKQYFRSHPELFTEASDPSVRVESRFRGEPIRLEEHSRWPGWLKLSAANIPVYFATAVTSFVVGCLLYLFVRNRYE